MAPFVRGSVKQPCNRDHRDTISSILKGFFVLATGACFTLGVLFRVTAVTV